MYALAMSHLTGYGGVAHDAEMAVKILVKICDHFVHPSAQLSLAKCFVVGLGVAADEDLGFKLCVTALNDDVAQVLVVKC
jgi:TPR repeat protein